MTQHDRFLVWFAHGLLEAEVRSRALFHTKSRVLEEKTMKSVRLTSTATVFALALLLVPVRLAAQNKQEHRNDRHHHYKLIDFGTFGGPSSDTNDELPILNSKGEVAGGAATATLDPNYPNSCFFCAAFGNGPYINHAFNWQNGTLVDLGALPGLNGSDAIGISENGLSAGFSELSDVIDPVFGIPEMHAAFWKHGQIFDLGTLEGGYESAAFQVNSRGQVAGFSLNTVPDQFSGLGTQMRTFVWDEQHGMLDLGTLGTGTDAGVLGFKGNVEINDAGQVVACSFTNTTINPVTGTPTLDPFLWDKNQGMVDLGTLGGTSGCALNINKKGEVVGYSNVAGDQTLHPFLWTAPGPMQDLGGTYGVAIWVNEAGEVVGTAAIEAGQVPHGFLWKKGRMIDLGVLSWLPGSDAEWINASEQIVGKAFSADFSTQIATMWENGAAPPADLNTLVPPGSGLLLVEARNINDRGEIAVSGVASDGNIHAGILVPCDNNHPAIEGCDYSMVKAIPVPQVSPESREAFRMQSPFPPSRANRFAQSGFRIRPRN
jgi:probable HAF family extracellular repeat protein